MKKTNNWLDQYDEELKYGGMKKLPGAKRFTSKNIQSSINTLFSRNHDLFGPSGKKYYSPLVKYFNGGFNQGNALPGATQSTDWSMMANPNAVDYRTQAYPDASNPTMMQGPAAPTVTDKLNPEMGLDYKQKFDNPLFGGGKLAGLARGLMPWATQLGNQDDYKAMQDKAFASTNANAVFRKDDQKNLGTHTMDTYGIDTMRPNQVGMTVFGQGLAYENQNIGRYGGENNWLDRYNDGGNTGNEPVATYTDYNKYLKAKQAYDDSLNLYNAGVEKINFGKRFPQASNETLNKIENIINEKYPITPSRGGFGSNIIESTGWEIMGTGSAKRGVPQYTKPKIKPEYKKSEEKPQESVKKEESKKQVVVETPKDYDHRQQEFSGNWKIMRYFDKAGKELYRDIDYGGGKVERQKMKKGGWLDNY